MKTSDFDFDLPPRLVAQYPSGDRGQSRLLVLSRRAGTREHRTVSDLPAILRGGDFLSDAGLPPLLVFNNSKVRKSRLLGRSSQTAAAVEFLLLAPATDKDGASDYTKWRALAQRASRRRAGSRYVFYDEANAEIAHAEITACENEFRIIQFDCRVNDAWLDRYGHIPLPPYIKRADSREDADSYQTVYADVYGSAAAPTAGLHFSSGLLKEIEEAGIESAFVTLHVGMGTFLPVRSDNIEDHIMHEEAFSIDEENAKKIEAAKATGRKIIAVGTTSLRTLESAWRAGGLHRGEGRTSIFIYPGFQFQLVDILFTNFHTPRSTLLMLVSAFAESKNAAVPGRDMILETYAEAIREDYRFFSYGDAMLIC